MTTLKELLDAVPPDIGTVITSIVTVITGIGTTIFFIRRKFSRDNVEIAKDRAEESIIQHLEEQRKIALHERDRVMIRFEKLEMETRKHNSEKLEMLQKIFKLSTEVQSLSEQISILKNFVSRLGTSLDDYKVQLKLCQEENKKLASEIVELENEAIK